MDTRKPSDRLASWVTFLFASTIILILASSILHYAPENAGGTLIDTMGELLPFVMITGVAIYYLLKRPLRITKGGARQTAGFFSTVAGAVLAIAGAVFLATIIFVLVFMFPFGSGGTLAQIEPPSSGGSNQTPPGVPAFYAWLLFSIFTVGFAVATILIGTYIGGKSKHAEEPIENEATRPKFTTSGVIRFTVDDERKAILAYYAQGREIIVDWGVQLGEHMTPREFEKNALSSIPKVGKDFTPLTHLFEEARFSIHPMGVPQKEEAGEHYEGLKKAIPRKKVEKS